MCLNIYTENSKEIEADIAETDITCYKVLRAHRTENMHNILFETPYAYMEMKLGKEYTDKAKIIREFNKDDECLRIGVGVFHSFKFIEDAISEIEEWAEA